MLSIVFHSPVYVDKNSNLYIVARRVVWGKFTNAGQTCVAPDYVMCTKEVQVSACIYIVTFLPIIGDWL